MQPVPRITRSRSRGGSAVARQILLLQVLVVLVVVVGAVALSYADARRTQTAAARDRALAVAVAVADTPQVRRALSTPDPSRTIQPFAEQVRRDSRTDFVVVMGLDRTRYSHPNPAEIGGRFVGDLGSAPRGGQFTQEYTGTLGRSMRAVVPVFAGPGSGRVVALVSVGITAERIQDALADRLPTIGLAAATILAVGLLGAWLISRRLRRQTHGLGEREITRMYEYYDAVLHAVREGLVLVDTDGRVQLVNDEAKHLLGLGDDAVGRPVDDLGLPPSLVRAIRSRDRRPDEIHLLDDAVLVVNTAPARWQGRDVGLVVTLRDHTEIQAVAGELDTVRGLAESLRSQNHEASNRLHTVVSLVELGRTDEALDFATEELEIAQLLTDRVVGSVSDPVVSALLLGKTAAGRGARGAAADRRGHRRHRAPGRPAGRGDDPGQPGRQRHRRGRGRRHPGGPGRPDRLPHLPAPAGRRLRARPARRAWPSRSSSAAGPPRPPTGRSGAGWGWRSSSRPSAGTAATSTSRSPSSAAPSSTCASGPGRDRPRRRGARRRGRGALRAGARRLRPPYGGVRARRRRTLLGRGARALRKVAGGPGAARHAPARWPRAGAAPADAQRGLPVRRDRGDRGPRRRGGQAGGVPGRRAVPAQAVHLRGVPHQARPVRRLPQPAHPRRGRPRPGRGRPDARHPPHHPGAHRRSPRG